MQDRGRIYADSMQDLCSIFEESPQNLCRILAESMQDRGRLYAGMQDCGRIADGLKSIDAYLKKVALCQENCAKVTADSEAKKVVELVEKTGHMSFSSLLSVRML